VFVSIPKHEEFYNGEEPNDDTLEPIAPEKCENAPAEKNRDEDGEKITKQEHFC
jgi:hypothetical protein